MEPIGFNYLPPLPDLNHGQPPHHQNTPSLPESAAGWIAFCEQVNCNPLQHPPPPPKHSQEQLPGIMQMLQIGMHIVGNLIPILHNNLNNHIIHTH